MNTRSQTVLSFLLMALSGSTALRAADASQEIKIVELVGKAEVLPAGATSWVLTQTNQLLHPHDRLRTLLNSRVGLKWSDQSVIRFDALTEMEVLPPPDKSSTSGLHLFEGILSFFHRDEPGRIRVITRGAAAGIRGTEFVMEERNRGVQETTTLSLIEGKVELSNAQGAVSLSSGEQAIAKPGTPPQRTPGFAVNNVLQWCFYYPAVLDVGDLELSREERASLGASLAAYEAGDLVAALDLYPTNRPNTTENEQVYRAALTLASGQVPESEAALNSIHTDKSRAQRLAAALRVLISAVKADRNGTTPVEAEANSLPTELLAASYWQQALGSRNNSLESALQLAQRAAVNAPNFSFAWERVAELEFSFGRHMAANDAVEKALTIAPRSAQALALKGFVLAAQNRTRAARDWFEQAIATDSSLANGWLGRGLCRIRSGDVAGGREDLLVAAALEPQRAMLRSYLGKAFADAGDDRRANTELDLARKLDPNDPTPLLYSAILDQQENRVNTAISKLEEAQQLNDNRSLFRSRLLLDQDRAVSSANLASIYRDAGMTEVSVREAAKAVTYDYANASAHLFLSDSYNELRDPTRFNLRYETVWFNELLLANVLSPVGAGRLSQNVSQQEYSRLFQADGLGIANSTLYRTDNKSVTEYASQFGTIGTFSYSLDLAYQHNEGLRVNNFLNKIEWYSTVKQQITPQDTVLFMVKYEDYRSGDNFQYYQPTNARPHFRFNESQVPEAPFTVGTWHHEWSPGMHTLVMGGRLETEQFLNDRQAPQLLLIQDAPAAGGAPGPLIAHDLEPFDVHYRSKFDIFYAEVNQICQWERVTLSVGGRYQGGNFSTSSDFTNPPTGLAILFTTPVATNHIDEDFERLTGYGYLTVEPIEHLWLIGGLTYDDVTWPNNFRNPPLTAGHVSRSQFGPKAGFVWNPITEVTLRGAVTRSLGGVSEEESIRLEQTQVAGFPQAFRSLISESIVGSVSAPRYDTAEGAVDLKFPTRTYFGIHGGWLQTEFQQTVGDLILSNSSIPFVTSSQVEQLRYREAFIGGNLNQLLCDEVAVGISGSFTHSDLKDRYPGVPRTVLARTTPAADLERASAYVLFNHPSGFFARADANWYHQHNFQYAPESAGEDFVQENIYAGYRFWHRHAEAMIGILNVSDQDYHLHSLTPFEELPRRRAFAARLNFIF